MPRYSVPRREPPAIRHPKKFCEPWTGPGQRVLVSTALCSTASHISPVVAPYPCRAGPTEDRPPSGFGAQERHGPTNPLPAAELRGPRGPDLPDVRGDDDGWYYSRPTRRGGRGGHRASPGQPSPPPAGYADTSERLSARTPRRSARRRRARSVDRPTRAIRGEGPGQRQRVPTGLTVAGLCSPPAHRGAPPLRGPRCPDARPGRPVRASSGAPPAMARREEGARLWGVTRRSVRSRCPGTPPGTRCGAPAGRCSPPWSAASRVRVWIRP